MPIVSNGSGKSKIIEIDNFLEYKKCKFVSEF